jgi:hypothetical protein
MSVTAVQPSDPERSYPPRNNVRTAWTRARDKANVAGRWHGRALPFGYGSVITSLGHSSVRRHLFARYPRDKDYAAAVCLGGDPAASPQREINRRKLEIEEQPSINNRLG